MTLDELKALEAAATPGPWRWTHDHPTDVGAHLYGGTGTPENPYPRVLDDGSVSGEYAQAIETGGPDAVFIAAARTMLPRLIAVAEAAKTLRIDVLADGADVSALVAALAALEAAP